MNNIPHLIISRTLFQAKTAHDTAQISSLLRATTLSAFIVDPPTPCARSYPLRPDHATMRRWQERGALTTFGSATSFGPPPTDDRAGRRAVPKGDGDPSSRIAPFVSPTPARTVRHVVTRPVAQHSSTSSLTSLLSPPAPTARR